MIESNTGFGIMKNLLNMAKILNSETDIDSLLSKLSDVAKEACNSDFASILLVDSSTNELYFKTALGGKGSAIKSIRIPFGSGIAGWVAQRGEPLIVNDAAKDPRFFGDVDKRSKFKTNNLLAVPIFFENEIIGVIEVGNKQNNEKYTNEDMEILSVIASQAGIALKNAFLVSSLQNFHVYVIDILVNVIDKNSEYGPGHSVRVARIATEIARQLGLDGKDFEAIYYGSLLHDIGVLASLQNQNDHPKVGASMINSIEILKSVVPIVAYHHEYFDGSGYPNGLSGKTIPQAARIVVLAEAIEEFSHGKAPNPSSTPERFDPNILSLAAKISLG